MEKHCHENLTKGPRNLGWELLLRGPTGGQVQGTWMTLACNHVSGQTRLGGWPGEGRGLGRLSPGSAAACSRPHLPNLPCHGPAQNMVCQSTED